jgi:hypothetical protein
MSVLRLEGMPVPVSADFDVSFMDSDGGRRSEPLSSCWMVLFEQALPVRAVPRHRRRPLHHRPDPRRGRRVVSARLTRRPLRATPVSR